MTITIRCSVEEGNFRIAAFGFYLEIENPKKQTEISISKGEDGIARLEVCDVGDISGELVDDGSEVVDNPIPVDVISEVVDDVVTSEQSGAEELFARLVELRKRLALEQGKPPYIIFHDSTLKDMVQELPSDFDSLSKIDGVGKVKLERYGGLFLTLICEHKGVKMAG